jgi:hypothetical protein
MEAENRGGQGPIWAVGPLDGLDGWIDMFPGFSDAENIF